MRAVAVVMTIVACDKEPPPREPVAPREPPAPAIARPHTGVTVTAHDVAVDGVSIGAARVEDRVTRDTGAAVAFTDDAPAPTVVAAIGALLATGHAAIDIALPGGSTCRAEGARGDVAAVAIMLRPRSIVIGRGGTTGDLDTHGTTRDVIPLFELQLPAKDLSARVRTDLEAGFFANDRVLELIAFDGATARELGAIVDATCKRLPQLLARAPTTAHPIRLKPLCRKIMTHGAFDSDRTLAALPTLDAMTWCYETHQAKPGPIGTATMRFEVEADGSFAKVAVTGLDRKVNECLAWLLAKTTRVEAPPSTAVAMRVTMECNTRCCTGD
jgi:hypothetical protein